MRRLVFANDSVMTDEAITSTDIVPGSAPETGLALLEGADVPRGEKNPVSCYLAGLHEGDSRRTQRQALRAAVGLLVGRAVLDADVLAWPWWQMTPAHANLLRAQLDANYAPATANRVLAAVRKVFVWCRRVGRLGA